MLLNEKIRILRKQKGLSQEQLAEIMNVSRQAVFKWESGESNPDIDKIKLLSKIFNVSFDLLLDDNKVISEFAQNKTIKETNSISTTYRNRYEKAKKNESLRDNNADMTTYKTISLIAVFIHFAFLFFIYFIFQGVGGLAYAAGNNLISIIGYILSYRKTIRKKGTIIFLVIQIMATAGGMLSITNIGVAVLYGVILNVFYIVAMIMNISGQDDYVPSNDNHKKENNRTLNIITGDERAYFRAKEYIAKYNISPQTSYLKEANSILETISNYRDAKELLSRNREIIANEGNEKTYKEAIVAYSIGNLNKAKELFSSINDYKDCKEYLKKISDDYENIYNKGCELIEQFKFRDAIKLFETIDGYKDSGEKLAYANEYKDMEEAYESAILLSSYNNIIDYKKAIGKLKDISDYRDSSKLIEDYQRKIEQLEIHKAKAKKVRRIVFPSLGGLVAIGIAAFLLMKYIFIPQNQYNQAIELVKQGNYDEAIKILETLNYSDSRSQISVINATIAFEDGDYEAGIDYIYEIGGTIEVNYNTNGGDPMPSSTIKKNIKHIDVEATRENYKFEGWTLEKYNIDNSKNNYKVTITLKAEWKYRIIMGDFSYVFDSIESNPMLVEVKCIRGTNLDVTLPETLSYNGGTIDNYTIATSAFENDGWRIVSLIVPNNVISIEEGAIGYCYNLQSVTLPFVGANETSTHTFGYVFGKERHNANDIIINQKGNTYYLPASLKNVIITSSDSIGSYAFSGCASLKNIAISSTAKVIGDYAFSGCSSLISITIPNSVTSIGNSAFYECSALTSITLSNKMASIGNNSFSKCKSLKNITIPNSVKEIGSYAFYYCSSLTSIIIGSSVKSIGDHAFSSCIGLTTITIPNNVRFIRDYAFSSCSRLTSIKIPDSVTSIGSNAFYGCSIETATIPAIACPCINNSSLQSVVITSGKSIGDYAFFGCSSLISITIPNSVTSIGDSVFRGCSGLTSIKIPDSVTSIGKSAFYGCSGLTSITIPDSVTSIENWAFYNCSRLSAITIPNNVTSIGNSAFLGCSGLTSITIPNSVTSIGNSAFYNCSSLTSITIPNTVTSIGENAFYYCRSLTSVTILATTPPTLASSWAFYSTNNCPIYVPAESVNAYKVARSWSNLATRLQAIS